MRPTGPERPGIRGSQDLGNVEIVQPGASWRVAFTTNRSRRTIPNHRTLWMLPDLPLRLDARGTRVHRSLEIASRFPQHPQRCGWPPPQGNETSHLKTRRRYLILATR